jgi:hypothetical protein
MVIVSNQPPEGGVHMQIRAIGVDLASTAFQIHGVGGRVVVTRKLHRKQVISPRVFHRVPCA